MLVEPSTAVSVVSKDGSAQIVLVTSIVVVVVVVEMVVVVVRPEEASVRPVAVEVFTEAAVGREPDASRGLRLGVSLLASSALTAVSAQTSGTKSFIV